MQLRTIPAIIASVFVITVAYTFGAIAPIEVLWYDYTLTGSHAMWLSVGTYILAFMSSETKAFDFYRRWEQLLIVAGPVLLGLYTYHPWTAEFINTTAPPWAQIGAAVVTYVGYLVATQ
ncbi:MAG: hypothetical protein U5K37_01235 [Natrialbaceae archaeon]|nr:hypothetical protein [Natrialbaceae archaeon]